MMIPDRQSWGRDRISRMSEGATTGKRWFVQGQWRGEYTYDPPLEVQPVPFTMQLWQRWFGFVAGTVQDESEMGTPDEGTIRGRIDGNGRISFVKRIPRCYVFNFDTATGRLLDS